MQTDIPGLATARYFPVFKYARQRMQDQAIGQLLAVRGDFAFQVADSMHTAKPSSRSLIPPSPFYPPPPP